MRLFIWPADFKIRSKANAEHFLHAGESTHFGRAETEVYWHDETYDYCLYPRRSKVGMRPQHERYNVFSPYLIVDNPVDVIWKTRKYLNAQIFCSE